MKQNSRAIRVIGGVGNAFTSPRRAIQLIRQRRARYVNDTTIEMIAQHHRHQSALKSVLASVNRSVAPARTSPSPLPVYAYSGSPNLRTFAPYPDAAAFGRAA